jgi:hypothetical protein
MIISANTFCLRQAVVTAEASVAAGAPNPKRATKLGQRARKAHSLPMLPVLAYAFWGAFIRCRRRARGSYLGLVSE